VRKILLLILLFENCIANAENSYIDIGTTNIGTWKITQNSTTFLQSVIDEADIDSKQNFISLHKSVKDSNLYLVGRYQREKRSLWVFSGQAVLCSGTTIGINLAEESCSNITTTRVNQIEDLLELGVGFNYSINSQYSAYADLSKLHFSYPRQGGVNQTDFSNTMSKNGVKKKIGLKINTNKGIQIDISRSIYSKFVDIGAFIPNNNSIKLVKDIANDLSLGYDYKTERLVVSGFSSLGDSKLKRVGQSLFLRKKF
jgi:hypothetical protein